MKLRKRRSLQAGFTLIEGMVSILIFSIGVLALVGLQSTSVGQAAQAQYRSDASMLANELIGQMWAGENMPGTADPATFLTQLPIAYGAGTAPITAWSARVAAALPGTAANPPTVTFGANGQVTVRIWWRAPNEPATQPAHNFTTVTQVTR